MQMSIVKTNSRFESKMLVSAAIAEMIEDEKLAWQEAAEEEYDDAMFDMIQADYDDFESGRDYYADEEVNDFDYGSYDDYYYDSRDDYYFADDYYASSRYSEPMIPKEKQYDAGESLGDILARALARQEA